MLRMIFGNKIVSAAIVVVVLLAVWKVNDGNPAHIADAIWAGLNKAADTLVEIWHHFVG